MAEYRIMYDSSSDELSDDFFPYEQPFLTVDIIKDSDEYNMMAVTICFPHDDKRMSILVSESDPDYTLTMGEVGAILTLIESESSKLVESGGSVFYCDVFHNEETGDFDRELILTLER